MGYSHLEKIVAHVPAGRKKPLYDCRICAVTLPILPMKKHLEEDHKLKVSGGGYAFFKDED